MINLLGYLFMPLVTVAAPVLQNITISVPKGTSNHGNPHLLCTPTQAIDVASFFLVNYLAHAATVSASPGQLPIPAVVNIIFAFVFPVSGVIRGLRGIYQATIFEKDPLKAALQAGAVCEVVRTKDWQPKPGDRVRMRKIYWNEDLWSRPSPWPRPDPNPGSEIQPAVEPRPATGLVVGDIDIPSESKFFIHEIPLFSPTSRWTSITGIMVHGQCKLPHGYALSIIPVGAEIHPYSRSKQVGDREDQEQAGEEKQPDIHQKFPHPELPSEQGALTSAISSNYSASKGLIAILQLVYGSFTIYRTRGDQVARYGYAAFGLTVAPYLRHHVIHKPRQRGADTTVPVRIPRTD